MTLHYITSAFRSLKMNKLYSALSIGGFAVGFSICIIIGLYAYQELTVDQGFEDSERIYRIIDAEKQNTSVYSSFTSSLKEQIPEIEDACSYTFVRSRSAFMYKSDYYEVNEKPACIYTNDNFFKLFSLDILHRESEELFIDENSVVLSESFSKELFGNNNPIGQSIEVKCDGRVLSNFIVSAVVEDLPDNTSMPADFYLDQKHHFRSVTVYNSGEEKKSLYLMGSIIKVSSGVKLSELEDKFSKTENPMNIVDSLKLQPLHDIYLGSNGMSDPGAGNNRSNAKLVYILLTIAILILILSLINFINYSTARYLSKAKITAIRKANGASTKHILKYDIAESCLSIIISIFLAAFFTYLLWPYASDLLGKEVGIHLLFTPRPFSLLVMVLLLVFILNTVVLLWGVFRFDFMKNINGQHPTKGGKTSLLTIFQFTIAISLLISLFTINKQLYFVKNINLGFDKENIVFLNLNNGLEGNSAVKAEFDKLPFISKSSLSNGVPHSIRSTSSKRITTLSGKIKEIDINTLAVDENFLSIYNIGMKEGESFKMNYKGKGYIINQAVLAELELESIEGVNMSNHWGKCEIIGVIKDFHFESYHAKIEPLVISFGNPKSGRYLSLKLLPGNFAEQKKQMQEVWKSFSPDDPLELKFIDAALEAMYKQEEQLSKSITSLCLIAFLLVTLGILGQVFQITLNKTKEIAIRKVNGAHLFDIFKIINGRFVIWVAIGFILAVPLAYYALGKWLENFAYKTPLSWWVFALAGLFTLLFVIGIVTLQSWKTANRNPVESLRHE